MARITAKTDKQLSRRVLVEIERDMTAKTPKVVWQHEIPVIEAIYGEGKVRQLDPSSMDEGYTAKISPALLPYNKKQEVVPRPSEAAGIGFVFIGDPRIEYERLVAAYGRINDKEGAVAAEKVYGRFQEGRFEAMVAGAEMEDLPETQIRSLIAAYGAEPTGALKDMSDAEKDQAATARVLYLASNKTDLIKLAQEAGVQLG